MRVLVLAAVLVLAVPAVAQDSMTYRWTAPVTGSPVVYYLVELQEEDGGPWHWIADAPVAEVTFMPASVPHRIRVAGVDVIGRVGDWSEPSEWDLGGPGQPGQPWLVGVILGGLVLLVVILGLIFGRRGVGDRSIGLG